MRRKFFRVIWKAKTPWKIEFFRAFKPLFWGRFFKKPSFFAFPCISFDWCVVRFRFLYEREDMIQGHLLDTLNMVIGCVENFLEWSEKQKHLQKSTSKKRFESSKKLYFWRCFCFSDQSKNFSTHPVTMFKVSRRWPWIISLRSYKNQNPTTYQSKDIAEKPIY